MAQVTMPRLSDSMETGKIIRWLKKEGEQIKKGEALVEIESDKANIEVEAYAAGVLSKIVVAEGQSAAIGALIAEIGGGKEPAAAPAAPAPRPAEPSPPAAPPSQGRAPEVYPGAEEEAPAQPAAPSAGREDRARRATDAAPSADGGDRVKVSPVARRLAEELGVDLSRVRGSGPQGRIVREDVEAMARQGAGRAPAVAEPAALKRPAQAVEVVELSGMQAAVARRLAQSKAEAPHFYVTAEIAMDDAVHLRAMINQALPKEESISFNDLVVKAAAEALRRFPDVNASWANGRIERKGAINVGIAVNLEHGLIVPVIQNADQKSVKEIAAEARALAGKARARKLQPAEYEGGTFTVSNLGMHDVDQFTAIINPPESAILAVGSILDKAVVRDGQVVAAKRMRVTLSVDHRVFYGVTAAQFLQELKRLLQTPAALLL